MKDKKLLSRIATLEFVNDQVVAELNDVDQLLRSIGFSHGLKSLKKAAEEIYQFQLGDEFFPPDSEESPPS